MAPRRFANGRAGADRGHFGPGGGRFHGIAGPETAIPLRNVHAVSSRRGFWCRGRMKFSEMQIDDNVNDLHFVLLDCLVRSPAPARLAPAYFVGRGLL